MRYLQSTGGGVNSAATTIFLERNFPDIFKAMEIVFADTGGELPETYQHIAAMTEWLKKRGKTLTWVGRPDTLEEYCLKDKVNPLRQWRWCTDKWKIRPINEWADANIGRPRVHILGIAYDEAHRAKPSPVPDVQNWFPLVEAKLTRQACLNLIADARIGPVVKSGCFFCPLMPSGQFVDLKQKHPDLFARAVAMEKAAGHPLKHKYLEDIVGLKDKQGDLFLDLARECDSGYCFT